MLRREQIEFDLTSDGAIDVKKMFMLRKITFRAIKRLAFRSSSTSSQMIFTLFSYRLLCLSLSLFLAAELITFYTIFYIALAALFAICMKGLLMTINTSSPKWMLNESLIGTNPGLGFRPLPENVDHGSLIWYDVSDESKVNYWTNILDDFMNGAICEIRL